MPGKHREPSRSIQIVVYVNPDHADSIRLQLNRFAADKEASGAVQTLFAAIVAQLKQGGARL